jgi:hypothetical protein
MTLQCTKATNQSLGLTASLLYSFCPNFSVELSTLSVIEVLGHDCLTSDEIMGKLGFSGTEYGLYNFVDIIIDANCSLFHKIKHNHFELSEEGFRILFEYQKLIKTQHVLKAC